LDPYITIIIIPVEGNTNNHLLIVLRSSITGISIIVFTSLSL
jgi:hypothetical protein